MAEIAISVVAEVAAENLVDSMSTQLGYIWNYKTNFENLEKQVKNLQGRKDMVQHAVEEATRKGDEIEQLVQNWLDSANKMIDEATEIIVDNNRANMRCFKRLCPDLKKRYQHSKKAAVKANEVSELANEGRFDKVSYRTLPKEPWDQFLNDYKDFESRRSIVDDVLTALSNDGDTVGIYGMGGAGKTTIARVVGKRAEKEFDVVVFVEVSEKPDVEIIQGVIGDKLGLKFEEETVKGRANKLFEQLQKKSNPGNKQQKERKILLILDNIWKGFELKEVGIPLRDDDRAFKLLWTARSTDVLLGEMDTPKRFSVDNLKDEEAWDLFQKVAGACIEQDDLKFLGFEVAKRCGGLPVAIVAIAKALKSKPQVHAWRNALRELERSSPENLEGVTYSCIWLSYDQLISEELKSTFLRCCTMGFTSNVSTEDLLRYGMGSNLFERVYTMEEAWDRVNTLVQELKNSSLLLDTSDSERFSIHDVVRDVGRAIAFKYKNYFTIKGNHIWQDLVEKNTLKGCTSITLLDVTKLPGELDCPQLSFFYMKPNTRFPKIPDNFFRGMPSLEVLHLVEMNLLPLPASLRFLEKLRTLYLDWCHLGDIADIGDLTNLEILVLNSKIEQLPEEIGQLSRLRILDLSKCSNLSIIPPNTISKLTHLEELYMAHNFDQWQVEGVNCERSNVSLGELVHLSHLTALQICIPDAKATPKGLVFENLRRYKIRIGERIRNSWHRTAKSLNFNCDDASIGMEDRVIKNLKEIEELSLCGNQSVKNVLYELDRDGFRKLKLFQVGDNSVLLYVVDSSEQSEASVAFPRLESLSLRNMSSLKKICNGQLAPNSFCQLKSLTLEGCEQLKNVFSSSIARLLSQLQRIRVSSCKDMEEIFTMDGRNEVISEQSEASVAFPRLESLSLWNMSSLKKICNGQLAPNSFCQLKSLTLVGCEKLKNVFSSSIAKHLSQLEDIDVSGCGDMEEIFTMDGRNEVIVLDQLQSLSLSNLPKLRSFCYEAKVGSTSGQERQMIDTSMPLFDGKVEFPNLKTLSIASITFEKMWHNELRSKSDWFQNLKDLTIMNCDVKYLFSSSTLRSFVQLQSLEINRCKILEEIISIDNVVGHNDELPSLKKLSIWSCPEMKTFIFSDKVAFPSLEEIHISSMDNLKLLWHNQLDVSPNVQYCPKLSEVTIRSCPSLKNLFPASIAKNLLQLKILEVESCGIEEIVAKEEAAEAANRTFEFEQLTCLRLQRLKKLRCFYPGIHTTAWPMLKILVVTGCEKLHQFFPTEVLDLDENISESQFDVSQQTLFLVKKDFSNLEELAIDRSNKTGMNWERQFSEILFPKVKVLGICNDDSEVLPLEILQIFNNMEKLSLQKGFYREIFSCEQVEKHAQIKSLDIDELLKLEQLWKQDSTVEFIFQNIENLNVRNCHSLVTLVSHSASFQNLRILVVQGCGGLKYLLSSLTAKSLVQLEKMEISICDEMIEVVADEEVGAQDEIIFSKLKSLKLIYLSKLKSFYSGNFNFKFPILEELSIASCPKMKIFSSTIVSTPTLREISIDYRTYSCKGDINTTILRTCENLLFTNERPSLFGNDDISKILQKSPEIEFPKVKYLQVFDDESILFPLDILLRFPNLRGLQLKDSSYEEIFSCEEMENHSQMLAQIKDLHLQRLDHMKQIWKQDSKNDLILHDLKSLIVWSCNSLVTLMPTSVSFQNLRKMEVSNCNGLVSLMATSVAKSLVQLESLEISNCNMMIEIVANGDLKGGEIIFNKLKCLKLTFLSNLTNFCSGNNTLTFPLLDKLEVTRCPKLQIFSPKASSTPVLPQITWESIEYILEGDLNTTIQRMHEKLNTKSSTKDFASSSMQHPE